MISGVGLHSGAPSRVRFFIAPGPVRFRRGKTEIPAQLSQVVATPRCTVLGEGAARLALVEHLLAALYVRGWWRNLLIEVSADELPILDGSALPWLGPIDDLGPPPPPPEALKLKYPLQFRHGDSRFILRAGLQALEVGINFAHPVIGQMHWRGEAKDYESLLAARTFGFVNELDPLRAQGLATGASLENVIVFTEENALTPLRFDDEPVRHKALDALGDLFLLGCPLAGKLSIERGSHESHVAFLTHYLNMQATS